MGGRPACERHPRGQGSRYPIYDDLGSVVGFIDETARSRRATATTLGTPARRGRTRGRSKPLHHRLEPETGFYREGARYHACDAGRFVTQDSYLGKREDPFSLPWYLYAIASPPRYVDPTGHQSKDLAREYRLHREEREHAAFRSWYETNPQACAAKIAADAGPRAGERRAGHRNAARRRWPGAGAWRRRAA